MKCPHCGNEVEIEIFFLKGKGKVPLAPHEHLVLEKKESFQIHENEGGPPPAIPRGMQEKKPLSAAERQKAYRERMKGKK